MQQELFGPNIGIFVLGRAILKHYPTAQLKFSKNQPSLETGSENLSGAMFWKKGIEYCAKNSRFGRVGIFYERKNDFAEKALFELGALNYEYKGKEKRSETELKLSFFPTQILYEMALEGWGSSVEFRRIVRKFIREAKNANCDTVFFPEAIFGEESTQKTLHDIAGSQLKVITLADILEEAYRQGNLECSTVGSQHKIVISDSFSPFEQKRSAQILRTKLPKKEKNS